MNHFRLANRHRYPWFFLILAVAVNGAVFIFVPYPKSIDLLIPGTGIIAGLVYFLYSQHLQETRLFADLFRQFNERYDHMNERLNEIFSREEPTLLSPADIQALFDYFNLCAEEFLYFKSGYIDKEVWDSWVLGMSYFASNRDIYRLWQKELEQGSYYGFTLSLLDSK